MPNVKSFDFKIDSKNYDDGLKQLLHEIKPDWEWNNIEKKILSGGYSCIMMRCYEKSNSNDSVTVRVRNLLTELGDANQLEIKALKYLSKIGYFPDLLAFFGNGYCYQYIKGKPAVNFTVGDINLHDTMLRAAAKKLVQLHKMEIPGVDMKTPTYYTMFRAMLKNNDYKPPSPRCPSKEVILNECSVLEQFLADNDAPIVLCHGDTHPGNMVWNEQTETITLVDWELVHVGYQWNDLARFVNIASTGWRKIIPFFAQDFDFSLFPQNIETNFTKFYYEEWCKVQHKKFTQTELDTFRSNVQKAKMCDTFMLVIFGALVPEERFEGTALNHNLKNYQETITEIYLNYKEKFFGRRDFG